MLMLLFEYHFTNRIPLFSSATSDNKEYEPAVKQLTNYDGRNSLIVRFGPSLRHS